MTSKKDQPGDNSDQELEQLLAESLDQLRGMGIDPNADDIESGNTENRIAVSLSEDAPDPDDDYDDGEPDHDQAVIDLADFAAQYLIEFDLETDRLGRLKAFWDFLPSLKTIPAPHAAAILGGIAKNLESVNKWHLGNAHKLKNYIADHFDYWSKKAMGEIDNFDGRDAQCTLVALKRLRIKPSSEFMNTLEQRIIADLDFLKSQPHRLANILHNLVLLEHSPSAKFLETVPRAAINVATEMNIPSLGSLIRSATYFSSFGHETEFKPVAVIAKGILETNDLTHFSNEQHQLATACLWFDWAVKQEDIPEENETPSKAEFKLRDLFNQAGFKVKDGSYVVERMKHKVDLTLEDYPDLIIEVDGAGHFLRNAPHEQVNKHTKSFDSRTIFQSNLMLKLEPDKRVLRIAEDHVNKLAGYTPERRKTILTDWVEGTMAKKPGAYCATYDKEAKGIVGKITPLTNDLILNMAA